MMTPARSAAWALIRRRPPSTSFMFRIKTSAAVPGEIPAPATGRGSSSGPQSAGLGVVLTAWVSPLPW